MGRAHECVCGSIQGCTVGKCRGIMIGPRHSDGLLGPRHEPEGLDAWGDASKAHAGGLFTESTPLPQGGNGRGAEPTGANVAMLQLGVRRFSRGDDISVVTIQVLGGRR